MPSWLMALVPVGEIDHACDVVIGVSRGTRYPSRRTIHPTNNMIRKDIGRFPFMNSW